MTVQDELTDDVWHILLHIYSYQQRSRRLKVSPSTRLELADEVIALNALAESIVTRVARLADKRRDVRSIKNLCKGKNLSPKAKALVKEFYEAAKPVVSIRHERIAHMKAGNLSAYPMNALPPIVFAAVDILVRLLDAIQMLSIRYRLKVGSQEKVVDLRATVIEGTSRRSAAAVAGSSSWEKAAIPSIKAITGATSAPAKDSVEHDRNAR